MSTPTKGNTTSANPTPGANFKTQNHTQNTGSNGLVIAQFTMSNARSYTTCTYGGVAMTQLYTISRGGLGQRMAFFYLENPPTGTNQLRINFNSSQWNPISMHIRSLTVEQDSLIMITSCSVNAITSQQIPTGTNQTYTQHNTNRQVATGSISANAGESAGTVSVRATSTFGSITLDRTEIKGLGGSVDTTGGDFFLLM